MALRTPADSTGLCEGQELKLEVLPSGMIQVRVATVVCKDGVEIGRSYHRHCLPPGSDTSEEAPETQAVAAAVWTPEVVAAYEAKQAEQAKAMEAN
jgi:hypothetical protein|tara:strand:- start:3372 stop:3659 length:288 start_codon:yes stop_codon:yes gene_type:complete